MSFKTNMYPHYDLAGSIQKTRLDTGIGSLSQMRLGAINEGSNVSFSEVMSGLVDNLNTQLNEPDNLLKDLMSGNKNVDIHDIATAMAKSEISINVATQVTGKVIQAYDRIMQINV
ncbi:flagellar hook-basal body complex protein FliE [bacterium]|nr:flagellar hook-basal body complex protein FliE [bacterium]